MSLEILEPGFITTVQDLGRFGYQRLGIPTAGAMDLFALMAANVLVGNHRGAACLEMALVGARVTFHQACLIAVAGADFGPRIDGWSIEGWRAYLVRPGSLLDFSGRRSGAYGYLAVSGGIALEPWLGSRSTYLMAAVGGMEGRALRAGDRLPVGGTPICLPASMGTPFPVEPRPPYSGHPTVRVIPGPHLHRFTSGGLDTFFSDGYRVTPSWNRMGYRLEGPPVTHSRGPDLVSCGVQLGSIQVPGNGQPIVLLADHQTMGGYTMVATVIQADIPLVAQCIPSDRMMFRPVDLQEARDALRRQMSAIESVEGARDSALWADRR